MTGTLNTWALWIGIIAGLLAIISSLYMFTRWARKQFRDAVLEDIKPLLEEIGASVNNIQPGSPKLIDRVTAAQEGAVKAAHAAKLALAMGEENGMKIEELSTKLSVLSGDVQVLIGSKGFEKS